MIREIISPRWRDFQKSLACILNISIGVISSEGNLVSLYNPLPPLSEIELYPKLHQDYQEFYLNVLRSAKKIEQVEIIYDPLGLPAAIIKLDMHSFLILMGGFDEEQLPSPLVFSKRLENFGIPDVEAVRLQKNIGLVSLEELKTKAESITNVYLQMVYSSSEALEIGQKMILLTAVDEISKLTVGLLNPGKFDLTKVLDLVVNSLIILCDAEGAFVVSCRRFDKQFVYRGQHDDFERFLREQLETVDADDPACLCFWDGVKKDPYYGLDLHMTSFTKEKARVCIGVVNPLFKDIQAILDAFSRQVNIATELSLLYELLQEQVGFLLNSIRHGIITISREGKIMVINKAARNIFEPKGISLAIGHPFGEQGLCPSMTAAVQDTTANGSSHLLKEDTLLLNSNHQKIYLSWDVSPLYWENGDIAGAILIIEDITVRRLSEQAIYQREQEFKLLVENAPDIIARFDRDLCCTYINEAFEKQMGLSRNLFMGQTLNHINVIPEEVQLSFQQVLMAVFNEGKEKTFNYEYPKAEGMLYFSSVIAPEFAEDGSVQTVLAISRNVTKLKLMEEEYLKASKLESIGILAGGIAHDFNNFLATMLANISLARLYGDNLKKIHDKLEGTEKAILRAKELTQQLFIFAKGSDPVKKTVSIDELIRESTNFALSGSSVSPEYYIPEGLLPVEIDVGQINQIINNIVINAVQAMPEGGKIKVRAENVNMEDQNHVVPLPEGQYVLLSIQDEGVGIPEKHLSKIFDPFFTTKAKGSGLGLTTSYKIIQKHKGHLNVKSAPGVGTTFSVYLPASNGAVQVMTEEKKYIKGRGKILIMDDEVSIRETTGEMLSYLGYEVDFAADGLEALTLYKEEQEAGRPFDAVILDLTIPGGMGGRATMAELLAIDPGVKAVVASGYSNDQVMANCQNYGFIDILVKPFKMEELSRVIHTCLQP